MEHNLRSMAWLYAIDSLCFFSFILLSMEVLYFLHIEYDCFTNLMEEIILVKLLTHLPFEAGYCHHVDALCIVILAYKRKCSKLMFHFQYIQKQK
jgi:hypothetical protein